MIERQARYGPNAIREGAQRSVLRMLLAQFTDFIILLLIAAARVSGFIGEVEDTAVILGIVVLNATIGLVQEFRAERAVAALKRLAAPGAVVVRDGQQQAVPAEVLVPGDIVLLEAGNMVPADLRLLADVAHRVPVVVLGFDENDRADAVTAGAHTYLPKTGAPDELLCAVRRAARLHRAGGGR